MRVFSSFSQLSFVATTAACAGFLFLTACAVGPDFKKPSAPEAASYAPDQPKETVSAETDYGAAQSFAAGEDIPAEWWTLFHSDSLKAIVSRALKANPDLAAAQASLRAAQENTEAAEGYLFPVVDAGFSSSRQKVPGSANGGAFPGFTYTLHNASVNVSYGLDLFGGTRRAIEQFGAEEDVQRYELEAAYLTLTGNVVTTAILEASLRGQIDALKKIIVSQDEQLDVIQKQLDLGAVDRLVLLQQQTIVQQTRASLPPLEKQLAITRHELSILTGDLPSNAPAETFDLSQLTLPEKLPISLPSKLVDQRPDIKAAEANLHAASAAIGVAVANRLPQISLTANLGSEANKLGDLFSAGTWAWGFGGSAVETVFDAGTLAHEQGAAEADFDVAKAQYKKAVLAAFKDVADALRALEADAAALKADAAADKAASESLSIAQLQYTNGSISYLTFLIAQQTAEQAKIALVQAEGQRFADTAALFEALGGGWWNRKEDITASANGESK